MTEWIDQYRPLLGWIAFASLTACVASAVLVPWWIIRLPADYLHPRHHEYQPLAARSMRQKAFAIAKNLIGLLLILAGALMLLLPGQGLLAIFAGILLIECPGKHRLVRWIGTRRTVWHSANWLRKRAGRPPFVL